MSVAAADVKALFPELASVSDASITRWLGFAQIKHNETAFGARSDYALICLAAHLVELEKRRLAGHTGPAMSVQSRSVGEVTTAYAVTSGNPLSDAVMSATMYGQLYLDLRAGVLADRVLD